MLLRRADRQTSFSADKAGYLTDGLKKRQSDSSSSGTKDIASAIWRQAVFLQTAWVPSTVASRGTCHWSDLRYKCSPKFAPVFG